MGEPDYVNNFVKGLAESGRRVRFAPGVVGKTTNAQLGLIALYMIVAVRLSATDYVLDALLGAVAILATVGYWRYAKSTRDFAERNPGMALMEGADLLEYHRFEAATKGSAKPEIAAPAGPEGSPIIDITHQP